MYGRPVKDVKHTNNLERMYLAINIMERYSALGVFGRLPTSEKVDEALEISGCDKAKETIKERC